MSKPIKNLQDVWEDSTPFDALRHQFGLKENDVIKFIINKNPLSLTLRLLSMMSYKIKRLFGKRDEEIDAV
jgi:uncharacterized protein (TIGR03643 family)